LAEAHIGSAVTGTAIPVPRVSAYQAHGQITLSGEPWSPGAAHFKQSLEIFGIRAAYGIFRRMWCIYPGGLPGFRIHSFFQDVMPGESIRSGKSTSSRRVREEAKRRIIATPRPWDLGDSNAVYRASFQALSPYKVPRAMDRTLWMGGFLHAGSPV